MFSATYINLQAVSDLRIVINTFTLDVINRVPFSLLKQYVMKVCCEAWRLSSTYS